MSDEQDHMDYEVNNHVEVSVTPFPCKGRLPKKKSGKSVVFCQTRGGVSEGKQKTKPQVCKCVFSVSMQNHSRTPKTCLGHV